MKRPYKCVSEMSNTWFPWPCLPLTTLYMNIPIISAEIGSMDFARMMINLPHHQCSNSDWFWSKIEIKDWFCYLSIFDLMRYFDCLISNVFIKISGNPNFLLFHSNDILHLMEFPFKTKLKKHTLTIIP